GSSQCFASFRTSDPNRSDLIRRFGELHLVHDDEAPKGRQQCLHLCAITFQQQRLSAIEDGEIAQDPALCIQNKIVSATIELKVANVVVTILCSQRTRSLPLTL